MNCKCGFKFAGPGEFRNCEAFITDKGESGVVCPECGIKYIEGQEVMFDKRRIPWTAERRAKLSRTMMRIKRAEMKARPKRAYHRQSKLKRWLLNIIGRMK